MSSARRCAILHLAANRWWTGSADPIIHLVSGLRARGHHVLLGVTPGRPLRGEGARGGAAARGRACTCAPRVAPLALRARRPRGCARSCADEARRHRPRASLARPLAVAARPRPRRADGRARRWCGRSTTCARSSARLAARHAAIGARPRSSRCRARSRRAAARSGCRPTACVWIPGAADLPRFGVGGDGRADPRRVRARRRPGRGLGRRASPPTAATSCCWRASSRLLAADAGGAPAARRARARRARPARAARRRAGPRRTA